MHVRACVSRPNGAAGCPPPPSPFHVHSEPTTRPRLECHCSPPLLPSGEVAEPRPKNACLCAVCCVLVDARSGLGPEWGNRPPTPEPALDPHRRARSLSSESTLVSLTSARGCCPLPSAHCPVPVLSHSCGILGAARAG
jgi:hypothetical protein